eukprot:3137534-Pyramimonas_sp.AAC.2
MALPIIPCFHRPHTLSEAAVDPDAKPEHFWYNAALGESSWTDPFPKKFEDEEVLVTCTMYVLNRLQ